MSSLVSGLTIVVIAYVLTGISYIYQAMYYLNSNKSCCKASSYIVPLAIKAGPNPLPRPTNSLSPIFIFNEDINSIDSLKYFSFSKDVQLTSLSFCLIISNLLVVNEFVSFLYPTNLMMFFDNFELIIECSEIMLNPPEDWLPDKIISLSDPVNLYSS